MNRIFIICLCYTLNLISVPYLLGAVYDPLYTSDFANGEGDFHIIWIASGNIVTSIDEFTPGPSGSPSLLINFQSGTSGSYGLRVLAPGSGAAFVNFWYKAVYNGEVRVALKYLDAQYNQCGWHELATINNNTIDMMQINKIVNVPEGAKFIELHILHTNIQGDIWIADFSMDSHYPYGPWFSSKIGGGGSLKNGVIDTTDSNKVYWHTDLGGIFKSSNGGLDWEMIHDTIDTLEPYTRSINVDPRDANYIIATLRSGIFVSSDGGSNWTKTSSAYFSIFSCDGTLIARDPTNLDRLYVASPNDGILISEDNGFTWNSSGLEWHLFTDIIIDKSNPARILACAGELYRSEDYGETWEYLSSNPLTELTQWDKYPGMLIGISEYRKVQVSTDHGSTWDDFCDGLEIQETGPIGADKFSFRTLASCDDFILAGTAGQGGVMYIRSNVNDPWELVDINSVDLTGWFRPSNNFGWGMAGILIDPNDYQHWYMSDWYAIYQTWDGGTNWTITSDGIENSVVYCLRSYPAQPNNVYMGQADNGYFKSINSGNNFSWSSMASGQISNIKSIDVSPNNPARIYTLGAMSDRRSRFLNISTDYGATWILSPQIGLPDMEENSDYCMNNITVDPRDANNVYVTMSGPVGNGQGGVYRSTDGGNNWQWAGEGLPSVSTLFDKTIDQGQGQGPLLAISSNGAKVLISSKTYYIYYTQPDSDIWVRCNSPYAGVYPLGVVADVHNEDSFFLANGAWESASRGVLKTINGGVNWTVVNGLSANVVAVDPYVEGRIAASLWGTIIISSDGGDTWETLAQLPNKMVNTLCFVDNNKLLAGTHGNGVFWISLL